MRGPAAFCERMENRENRERVGLKGDTASFHLGKQPYIPM